MLAELRARAWQVGTFAAGVAAIGLAVALSVTTIQKNNAVDRADRLHTEIHAPVTGYIARLSLCAGNVERLDGALKEQNEAVADLRRQSDARIAQAQRDLAAAQRVAAEARVRAETLRTATPVGATTCERVLDVDALVRDSFR